MGIWDSLCSLASKAVEVVSSVVKSVGKAIVEKTTEFLTVATKTLELINSVVEFIAKKLGIIEDKDSAEDLGDRAMRAEKTEEDFNSTSDYIEYLKKEIEAKKPEELEKLSPEERLARVAMGTAMLSKAIEEKTSLEIPVSFWKDAVEAGLSGEEIDLMLKKFKEAGIAPADFSKYLRRELDFKDSYKFDNVLIEEYKELEPTLSSEEIEEKVINLKDLKTYE